MEHINLFNKGMNKDLSKVLVQPDTYLHAENLSLVTELGLSSGILRNIKGNKLLFDIPSCSNVSSVTKGGNGTGTVTVFLGITFTVNFASNDWARILANAINSDAVLIASGFKAAYTSTRVVVWGTLSQSNTLLQSNIALVGTGDAIIDNNYSPFVTSPKLIGWGVIRDTIILFTTEETSAAPTNSQGQIWKLEYDKIFYEPTLTLLYNNTINFSVVNPIANPGRFVGNFETPAVQKIYWTDNYNPPRTINITDPNTFALEPRMLDSVPDRISGNGVIQEILQSGGNLPVGTYQAAYRLKKNSGAKTAFYIPDNPLPITLYNDVVDRLSLTQGAVINSTTISSKQLKYTFYNLDTSFQNIEVALIYRQTDTSSPDIKVLIDEPIPSSGEFTCVISGNEAVVTPLSLEEFVQESLNFETVKTIASKNNYLFYGNVKYSDFDIDFDSRVYRFNSSGDTYETINTSIPDTWGVPKTADAINPNQDYNGTNPYIYQIDGTTIGGSGPRISYRFVEPDLTSQYKILLDNTVDANNVTAGPTHYNTARQSSVIDLGNDTEAYNNRPVVSTFADFRSPYIQAALKGYLRDEVYSFGIVFYSKKGEPSYVHWIGDIRIPHTYVQYNLLYPTTLRDGRDLYGFPMGIEFTVDTTGFEDLIDGYSIVRCERTTNDKTILGQGLMLNAVFGPGDVTYLLSDGMNINISDYDIHPSIGSFYSPDFSFLNLPSFRSNDSLNFVGLLGANQAMVKRDSNSNIAAGNITDALLYTKVLKNYEFIATASPVTAQQINYTLSTTLGVDGATARGTNAAFRFMPGNIDVSPTSYENSSSLRNRSMNNKLLAFQAFAPFFQFSNANAGWAITDEVENGDNTLQTNNKYRAYLMNYKRVNTDQYGGNTYSARSLREYISTGHIRRINNSLINTDMVFGGDTYVCLYDAVTHFPNRWDYSFQSSIGSSIVIDHAIWDDISNAPNPFGDFTDWGYWQSRIIPVETSVNINWRRNPNISVPNMDTLYGGYPGGTSTTGGTLRLDTYEDFSLETGYFLENNIVKFVPEAIGLPLNNKFDVRILRSSAKINGELTDSWGIFKEDDYIDVDTAQGELNNLIVHQDRLLSFQDRGISLVAVNDRALTQDTTGNQITLGTSAVLSRYDYISKEIGSRHQFGFTQSHDAIFFFDINTKNIYKLSGNSPLAITVAKGTQSYVSNNLNGLIQTNDNPYLRRGVTATYDFRYNEAIFTFKDTIGESESKFIYVGTNGSGDYYFNNRNGLPVWAINNQEVLITYTNGFGQVINEIGVITVSGGNQITVSIQDSNLNLFPIDSSLTISELVEKSFTLAYNDFIDGFTSFYSFTPSVYVNDKRNIFSPSETRNDLWIHDKFDYCNFYGVVYPSKLSLIVNPYPTETKVFDNYELTSESVNVLNQNVPDDTINTIRVYDDYQNSDFRDMSDVSKRKERTWNISLLRNRVLYTTNPTDIFTDLSPTDISFAERMRDKYLVVDMIYDNTDNNRLQLHTFKTHYRKSAR